MVDTFSDLTDASDEELVYATLKQANFSAYDEIVRRHQQAVAASLFHLCRNQVDLEDLVQETFIRAFRKLDKWKPDAPLLSWIRRIGYNLSYDYLRKQKRNPLAKIREKREGEDESQSPELQIPDNTDAIDKTNARNDLIDWLLKQLKPEDALLVTLMYVDQLTVLEIADRLGWGESKVKVKLHRTRKKLKQLFENHEELKLQYSAGL